MLNMAFFGNGVPGVETLTNPNVVNDDLSEPNDYDDLSELPHAACYTCNNRRIARFYDRYRRMLSEGVPPGEALDRLGFNRYCCRQLMMNPIKLPTGVNAEIDYRKLGLTLNPDNVSFRSGTSTGFLITKPLQQRRQGLAQAIGPSVPVVGTNQPLPPLMSRPTTTFGTQPAVPTIGQQLSQLPTTAPTNNFALPLLPTIGSTSNVDASRATSTLQMFGSQQQPIVDVTGRNFNGGPIIAPQGSVNRGLNMMTQGLGALTLQPRPNVNDPSNQFPMLESVPPVGNQTLGNASQFPFRM